MSVEKLEYARPSTRATHPTWWRVVIALPCIAAAFLLTGMVVFWSIQQRNTVGIKVAFGSIAIGLGLCAGSLVIAIAGLCLRRLTTLDGWRAIAWAVSIPFAAVILFFILGVLHPLG